MAWLVAIARAASPPRDPDALRRSGEARERLEQQSRAIADRMEAMGISAYRPVSLTEVAADGTAEERLAFRDISIIPSAAARVRREYRLSLSLFLRHHPRIAKFARYWVATSGARCPIAEIPARKAAMEEVLARWTSRVGSPLGIDVLLVSWEMPIDAAGMAHVHCNLLINPTRLLDRSDAERAMGSLRAALGAHLHDAGRLKNPDEICKYVTKPEEVLGLSDHHLADLAGVIRGMRLICPLGSYRAWRRDLRSQGLRVSSLRGEAILVARHHRGQRLRRDDHEEKEMIVENVICGIGSRLGNDGISQPVVRVVGYQPEPQTGAGWRGLHRLHALQDQAAWITDRARTLEAAGHGGGLAAVASAIRQATAEAWARFGYGLDRLLRPHLPNNSATHPAIPGVDRPPEASREAG